MNRKLLLFALVAIFAFAMIGCEGEEGPQGPAGPQGPQGPPGVGVVDDPDMTYIGAAGEDCAHCHSIPANEWPETAHAGAYDALSADAQENPYCLQCHTTGVDVHVEFGATEFPEGEDMYGYDDYFGVDTEEAAARRAELENVQCESCHGPFGPVGDAGFSDHKLEINLSTHYDEVEGEFTAACAPCHQTQLREWGGFDRDTGEYLGDEYRSGHASAAGGDFEAFQDEHYAHGSCGECHSAEGFISRMDPNYAGGEFHSDEVHFIGCVACHDPHSADNQHQVRTVGLVEVEYHLGYEPQQAGYGLMDTGTPSQLCASCHHARRDTDHVLNQIENGYAHFGPHSSPQMDMFLGYGSYEIDGFDYEREVVHQNAGAFEENFCVTCHMTEFVTIHGEDNTEHLTHDFNPVGPEGDRDFNKCGPCHDPGTAEGYFNDKTSETEALMNQLAQDLGYADWMDFDDNFDSQADGVTPDMRKAAYALAFVISDGTMGMHNWEYAQSLLQNAIDFYPPTTIASAP